MSLTTLASLAREQHHPAALDHPLAPAGVTLELPEGMATPLGCDAVGVPAEFGGAAVERLPRLGCVYAYGPRWWWLVPSGSSVSLDWPRHVRYVTGRTVPTAGRGAPRLVHRPEVGATAPYTPPIPLYLTLCRLTGTVPTWMREPAPRPAGDSSPSGV